MDRPALPESHPTNRSARRSSPRLVRWLIATLIIAAVAYAAWALIASQPEHPDCPGSSRPYFCRPAE